MAFGICVLEKEKKGFWDLCAEGEGEGEEWLLTAVG